MLFRWFKVLVILSALIALLSGGCGGLNPSPPVEQFVDAITREAIVPAIKEGLKNGVESLAIQAGAQGINPTYVVQFEGKWVVGLEGRASVGVEGVSGQMQVSSVSDADTGTPQ